MSAKSVIRRSGAPGRIANRTRLPLHRVRLEHDSLRPGRQPAVRPVTGRWSFATWQDRRVVLRCPAKPRS